MKKAKPEECEAGLADGLRQPPPGATSCPTCCESSMPTAFQIAILASTIAGPSGDPIGKLQQAEELLDEARTWLEPVGLPDIPTSQDGLAALMLWIGGEVKRGKTQWRRAESFDEWVKPIGRPKPGQKRDSTRCGFGTVKGLRKAIERVLSRLEKCGGKDDIAALRNALDSNGMTPEKMVRFLYFKERL